MATLFFDFDKTLLDTSKWLGELVFPEIYHRFTINQADFQAAVNIYVQSLDKYTEFSHTTFVPYICDHFNLALEEVDHILFDEEKLQAAIFPDIKTTLGQLKANHALGIFSEAEKTWQEKKLLLSGLLPFFDDNLIFILKRKETAEAVDQLQKPSFIIDDNKSVIDYLFPFESVTPIWINRQSEEKHVHATTIHLMTELPKIISIS